MKHLSCSHKHFTLKYGFIYHCKKAIKSVKVYTQINDFEPLGVNQI